MTEIRISTNHVHQWLHLLSERNLLPFGLAAALIALLALVLSIVLLPAQLQV